MFDVVVDVDNFGYIELWVVELVMFWREYAGARDRVVRAFVDVGEMYCEMCDLV